MKLLDLTLNSPAENLALDEALLEQAESERDTTEVLRLWESPEYCVVVGRSSKVRDEVDVDFCRRQGIGVMRRSSGGAAVVIGPGCLMYSVVLSYEMRPALRAVDQAHRFVLGNVARAVRRLRPAVRYQGISDLTVGERKFSGNSLRCKRTHLLYHGTILCDFQLDLISRSLHTPPRQPDYRGGRSHDAFVTNTSVLVDALRNSLAREWEANEPLDVWPMQMTSRLAKEKYARQEWTFRH